MIIRQGFARSNRGIPVGLVDPNAPGDAVPARADALLARLIFGNFPSKIEIVNKNNYQYL